MIISPALDRACKAAGITPQQLREDYKGREVVSKRFQVYHELYIADRIRFPKQRQKSYPDVGRLCHRDHSTVLYGCRQHSAEHYGTSPNASSQEMIAAYEAHQRKTGAAWVDHWLEGYGEFQIPQGAVEIVEEAA